MIENLTRDRFAEHLDTDFTFHFSNGNSEQARLVEVSELQRNRSQEGFSILFLAAQTAPVTQELIRVEHAEMGGFELFVVPVGKTEKGIEYEAIFNRAISS
jgi:hypothetical protein